MPTQKIINEHKMMMEKVMEHLSNEFKSLRTGRASTGLVENLRVDYYGTPTPLRQLAALTTPQSDLIMIKPFDPASIKEIEKAIKNSDISISPMSDGKVVRLNIPPLSGERRKQIGGQVKQFGEQAKVSIRNVRRDANKKLEDSETAKTITEDDLEHGKKEMDELTKLYTDKIDKSVKAKTDEIMKD
ncbi:MAG: ribosome recycling factor [Planctomycetes bacterium GWF2_42_9]|nr:MAG: ribosome recycling factor [Planctomycetes bacterium GWF2_42_9]